MIYIYSLQCSLETYHSPFSSTQPPEHYTFPPWVAPLSQSWYSKRSTSSSPTPSRIASHSSLVQLQSLGDTVL